MRQKSSSLKKGKKHQQEKEYFKSHKKIENTGWV